MSIKKINEQLDKFVENEFPIKKETGEYKDGDTYEFDVNKETPYFETISKIYKTCNKRLEEIKLLAEKDGKQLFAGRTATFRDLKLFIVDGNDVKSASPMQAINFLTDGNGQLICRIGLDWERAGDKSHYHINFKFD